MDQRITYLFTKYINNECSSAEIAEVLSILQIGGHTAEWNAAIATCEKNLLNRNEESISDSEADKIYKEITDQIAGSDTRPAAKVIKAVFTGKWPKVASAAVLILALGAALVFNKNIEVPRQQVNNSKKTIIVPGGNKAYLTLADGKKISLTDAANGTIASQRGISVTKLADGQLVYTIRKDNSTKLSDAQLNTITTSNGGQWQIRLPDGTNVWLNAASSLTYPASFGANKFRKVKLSGEAYFEVAKDSLHPFLVETDKQEVEVLGTHFNINSYTDEGTVKTTLLEGSVKVTVPATAAMGKVLNQVLKPGQQSVLNEGGIRLQDADMEEVMAWKNGYFFFDNEHIQDVMKKIARWYDVEIIYQGNITNEGFTGMISRNKKINEVLQVLERTKDVHFKIEGRTIMVMK